MRCPVVLGQPPHRVGCGQERGYTGGMMGRADATGQRPANADTWYGPVTLAPPEAFDDRESNDAFRARFHPGHDPTQLGPRSRAVRNRLRASCAGWREKPEPEEFYAAIRAPAPSRRQRRLLACWLQEATREDFLYAWAESVYTWRQLAEAIHRAGEQARPRCADINTLAAP